MRAYDTSQIVDLVSQLYGVLRMENEDKSIVSNIYHLRENFAIIGLTGRTGSGCSTIAKLFSNSDFNQLHAPIPSEEHEGISNDERKNKIIYNFAKENWKPFTIITASDIIFYFVFSLSFEEFLDSIAEAENSKHKEKENFINEFHNKLDSLKEQFESYSNTVQEMDNFLTKRESYFLRYDKENEKVKEVLEKK
mgnify:CR=1 FL=1